MTATQLSFRATDPATSREAALSAPEEKARCRQMVAAYLRACGEAGATDYEISVGTGLLRGSAAKRRCEVGAVDTGLRRRTDTGRSAVVWRLM